MLLLLRGSSCSGMDAVRVTGTVRYVPSSIHTTAHAPI